MFTRLIDCVALLLVTSGGILVLLGIAGGSTNLLSDGTPLALAGSGLAALYAALVLVGLCGLWGMDVPRDRS